MKPIFIVDTNSYIYLSQYSFPLANQDFYLINCLDDAATVRWSRAVSYEVNKHYEKLGNSQEHQPQNSILRNNRELRTKRFSEEEYETKLFGESYEIGEKDKGEKDNLLLAIDLFVHQNKRCLVLLTDDEKAKQGALRNVLCAFPSFTVLNSFDAVLFLYVCLHKKYFTFSIAEDAFRTINAYLVNLMRRPHEQKFDRNEISNDEYAEKMQKITEKSRVRFVEYIKRLRVVNSTI